MAEGPVTWDESGKIVELTPEIAALQRDDARGQFVEPPASKAAVPPSPVKRTRFKTTTFCVGVLAALGALGYAVPSWRFPILIAVGIVAVVIVNELWRMLMRDGF